MNQQLSFLLKNVRRNARIGGDYAPHYLLGYVWASLTNEKRQEICEHFAEELKQQEAK
jgi:hypothetical protein